MSTSAPLEATFGPVRSQTAFEETLERPGTAVKLGLLQPGERLPAERELCAMMGISGGAWTTTLVAALDSRIRGSYPVAGSLPFSLRGRGELADYENHVPPLYAIANYPELYVMGADTPTRTQIQVFNRYDPVGWSGDRGKCYEAQVQDVLARLGGGRFQVLVDDSHAGHRISRVALDRVLIDLCGGREGRSRDANGL